MSKIEIEIDGAERPSLDSKDAERPSLDRKKGDALIVANSILKSRNTLRRKPTAQRLLPNSSLNRVPEIRYIFEQEASLFTKFWVFSSYVFTCCFPNKMLSKCGIIGTESQLAWREKVALCYLILFFSAVILFFILFLNDIACPSSMLSMYIGTNTVGGVVIRGIVYNAEEASPPFNLLFNTRVGGTDATESFSQPVYGRCKDINHPVAKVKYNCEKTNVCLDSTQLADKNGGIYHLKPFTLINNKKDTVDPTATFDWDVIVARKLTVLNGTVLNLNPYVLQTVPDESNLLDKIIREVHKVNEATMLFNSHPEFKNEFDCISEKYYAGILSELPLGCVVSRGLVVLASTTVLIILCVRFAMAIFFSWFLGKKLSKTPTPYILPNESAAAYIRRKPVPTPTLVTFMDDPSRSMARSYIDGHNLRYQYLEKTNPLQNHDLYTVLLVTCYSEGERSLKNTLNALACCDYDERKKLFFVVCDGMVTGKGNKASTPQMVIDMIEIDPSFGGSPKPYSYVAVAEGKMKHNMAKVYCGFYRCQNDRVPIVVIVKCGTPAEQGSAKPGNRGKRDSQVILMNFFSRVLLNDRMTPLCFDLFRKIHHITGITPDFYETVLMVDADTIVRKDSLRKMTNAFHNNPNIMGLCGETRIENKRKSWITNIQVFEYFISHHLGKAFESVFGGVTCLPGCFCMYRIKARKDDNWIPIVVSPEITHIYSTGSVSTLHQKNLLLLGEDRFLSTMMLKNFPHREMVFIPEAKCKTIVPDDFKTLLSQRRRWINSTIHNLMELVLVTDLCGTFCFSMQCIVFMDLIGTAVLPMSLIVAYILIGKAAAVQYTLEDPTNIINLTLFLSIIFLPGMMLFFTKFKFARLGYFFIYILALPIWQIVIPLYSFWRFDDFSWGETRKVQKKTLPRSRSKKSTLKRLNVSTAQQSNSRDNIEKDQIAADLIHNTMDVQDGRLGGNSSVVDMKEDLFDASEVPLRRWAEYEAAWRRSLKKKIGRWSTVVGGQGYAQEFL